MTRRPEHLLQRLVSRQQTSPPILHAPKMRVNALLPGQQRCMRTALHNAALRHRHDAAGMAHGAQPALDNWQDQVPDRPGPRARPSTTSATPSRTGQGQAGGSPGDEGPPPLTPQRRVCGIGNAQQVLSKPSSPQSPVPAWSHSWPTRWSAQPPVARKPPSHSPDSAPGCPAASCRCWS